MNTGRIAAATTRRSRNYGFGRVANGCLHGIRTSFLTGVRERRSTLVSASPGRIPFVMTPWFSDDGMTVWNADARKLSALLDGRTAQAIVTDPPYGLRLGTAGRTARWDVGDVAFDPGFWSSLLDCVSPGGWLFSFGSPRLWHRLTCAVEDAGWIIRGQVCWLYAQGMPKGEWGDHAVDRELGFADDRRAERKADGVMSRRVQREGDYGTQSPEAWPWRGYNPSLKPAWEPIIIAQRPRDGMTLGRCLMEHGTGALNVSAGRIDADMGELDERYRLNDLPTRGRRTGGTFGESESGETRPRSPRLDGRYPSDVACDEPVAGLVDRLSDAPPFYYCAKASGPDRPVLAAQRVVRPGGDDWKNACERNGLRDDADLYPASVFHDHVPTGAVDAGVTDLSHPTVKPVTLVRWLVRLACPQGGLVLDPFLGTGTTMLACRMEGMECAGCERDPLYLPLIEKRLEDGVQTSLFA